MVAIWNYFQSRSTHTWNSFVVALRRLESYSYDECNDSGLEAEFLWHDVIIRLWLFRQCHRTLELFPTIGGAAGDMVDRFDSAFTRDGTSMLEGARDALECVADTAMDRERSGSRQGGVGTTHGEMTRQEFRKGDIALDLKTCKAAAAEMLETTRALSAQLERHLAQQDPCKA